MPDAPSSNSDTNYFNINECRSFGMALTISSGVIRLSGTDNTPPWNGQPCSEVIIINSSGGILTLYDNNYLGPGSSVKVANGATFTLRGLTNVNQISAQVPDSDGPIYYRTQYFSSNPAR